MHKFATTLLSLMLTAIFVLAPFQDAEAKRFGGGRSFGGRALYSTPYRRALIPKKPLYDRQKAAPQRQASAQRNQAARQSWRNRGGLLGMLAPFLIGGLLGALFFGGAFEHVNLADVLVLGGLAFLAFRLLARRPRPVPDSPYGGTPDDGIPDRPAAGPRQMDNAARPFDTDLLFGARGSRHGGTATDPELPDGFDADGFLEEAKSLFLRLQEAWNRGELADIRGLTTDDVFMEIKDQWQREGSGEPTEVLELDARLLDYRRDEDGEEAAVLFTALLREGRQPPERIEEIWHFVRPQRRFNGGWRLDGIQQVAD